MSKLTQLLSADSYGVTFADPLDPNFTVRFKTVKSRKQINGLSLDNYVTEIICNDITPARIGEGNVNDTVSVRFRVSGSEHSIPRLKAILASLASQVDAWSAENALLGFRPTTVPVNPL